MLTPAFFIRDYIFYTVSLTYMLIVLLVVKKFNIYIALGFLVNYTLYVIMVVRQSKTVTPVNDIDCCDLTKTMDKMEKDLHDHHRTGSVALLDNSPDDVKIGEMLGQSGRRDDSEVKRLNATTITNDHVDLLVSRKSTMLIMKD